MDIPHVLIAARTFLILNLNADNDTIKFLGAKYSAGTWDVKCAFKDKDMKIVYTVNMCISDIRGIVSSFESHPIG